MEDDAQQFEDLCMISPSLQQPNTRPDRSRTELQLSLESLKQQHEAEISAMRRQIDKYEQDCKANAALVLLELAAPEPARRQYYMELDSHIDACTPALLQGAVDAVKHALTTCATSLFTICTQEHSIVLDLSYLQCVLGLQEDFKLQYGPEVVVTAADQIALLEAFFCNYFFDYTGSTTDEEHLIGVGTSIHRPSKLFERPREQRRRCFAEHERYRKLDPAQILVVEESSSARDLNHESLDWFFTDVRSGLEGTDLHFLLSSLGTGFETRQAFIHSKLFIPGDTYTSSSSFHGRFERSLLQLTKEAWLLHKLLTSSFPAEMLWVGSGSAFDPDFMDVDDMNKNALNLATTNNNIMQALIMCAPGFTVAMGTAHHIIKARVWVLTSHHHNII